MASPIRLRLSRKRGFRLQEHSRAINGLDAVKVTRPGMWGNYPAIRVGAPKGEAAAEAFRRWVDEEAPLAWKERAAIDLRGKNLACFCKLNCACHGDLLLALANIDAVAGNA